MVRYYLRTGRVARAESRALESADAYSVRGLKVYAHFLEARRCEAEAEQVYHAIEKRYDQTEPLGTFMVRKALRTSDAVLQQQGWQMLRKVFPKGGERLPGTACTAPRRTVRPSPTSAEEPRPST